MPTPLKGHWSSPTLLMPKIALGRLPCKALHVPAWQLFEPHHCAKGLRGEGSGRCSAGCEVQAACVYLC